MPAGDSKNEPHRVKNLLSSFSVGAKSQGNKASNISSQRHQYTITQRNAASALLQRLSARAAKVPQRAHDGKTQQSKREARTPSISPLLIFHFHL
jgi:hypothetical protein